MFEYALLVYERHTCRRRTIGMRVEAIYVFGMNRQTRASLPPLVEADAEVFHRGVIQIETLTRGPEYPNELRAEVQHLPELDFTSAQFLLCSFALSDVDHSAHKFTEMAGRAQNRMTYDVNVPDWAIRMHNAE